VARKECSHNGKAKQIAGEEDTQTTGCRKNIVHLHEHGKILFNKTYTSNTEFPYKTTEQEYKVQCTDSAHLQICPLGLCAPHWFSFSYIAQTNYRRKAMEQLTPIPNFIRFH
jgi:hypothetical protein